jgi:type II secretory pathway component PulF
MAAEPRCFDKLCIAMVDAGEASGNLDGVLERFTGFRERWLRLKGRIVGSLIYPAVVLTAGIGVSVFLMTVVTPGLLQALAETGRPLPASTRAVKWFSDALVKWWWAGPLALAAVVVGVRVLLKHPSAMLAWHRGLLRLPVLGRILRCQEVTRICVVLSALLRSGVPFVGALRIARGSTRNLVIRAGLDSCDRAIQAGCDIGEAVERSGAFPQTVVRVFAVGQSSGRMEDLLDRLAEDFDHRVQHDLQRLVALLEPVLIVLLASLVGVIAFATILPILEAGNVR